MPQYLVVFLTRPPYEDCPASIFQVLARIARLLFAPCGSALAQNPSDDKRVFFFLDLRKPCFELPDGSLAALNFRTYFLNSMLCLVVFFVVSRGILGGAGLRVDLDEQCSVLIEIEGASKSLCSMRLGRIAGDENVSYLAKAFGL